MRRFKCGEFGYHVSECKSTNVNDFKCGKSGHRVDDCRSNNLTCFNCGEQGCTSTQCEKPKKAQSERKVFAFSGAETTAYDNLI